MKKYLLPLVISLVLSASGKMFAQSDACATATLLTVGAAPIAGTSAAATVQAGEPTPTCGLLQQTVWYKFVATSSSHAVSINKTGGGCLADAVVYSGTCFTFTEIGSNCSVSGGTNPNLIVLNGLTSGATYYIQLPYSSGGPCGANWTWDIAVTTCGTAKTWVTSGTNAWGTATNWSPAGVPSACNDVTIPSGGTQPTISAAASCRNLTINAGANLINSSGGSGLNIYGNLLNNGNLNDALVASYTNLYGTGNTWGGTGTFLNGATQGGWVNIQSGANYTLTCNPTIARLHPANTASTGSLSFGSNTITVTVVWYCQFYTNFNTGMLRLKGGGGINVAKSNYGTGVLWIDSDVNGFNFNLEDDYYSVWFNNSAGATKFGNNAADVFVKQDVWNRNPGTLDFSTNGSNAVVIGHDWINDAGLLAGTATIRMRDFNVPQTQNIRSTNGTVTTFNQLEIDNSGPGVFLQINTNTNSTSTGILRLTNGPLYLNGFTFNVQQTPATAIVRTAGWIVSETNTAVNPSILQWNMGLTTGAHVFPFGTASGAANYIPFTFNKTTGTTANISISTRRTTGSDNTPWAGTSNVAAVANMFDAIIGGNGSIPVVIDRWWDIRTSAAVTANLIFSYRGVENTTTFAPTGTFAAQHWNGTIWELPVGSGTGVTGATVGTVSVTGASTFSPWVLSALTAPLPVELVNFDGEGQGEQNLVYWDTESEINSAYFIVEKSNDAINYQELTRIESADNSNTLLHYHTIDANPYPTTYYKLRQVDLNGDFKYYGPIVISNLTLAEVGVNVYPNPAKDYFFLDMYSKTAINFDVFVFDTYGRLVYSKVFSFAGAATFQIPSETWSPGLYTVKIVNEEKGLQFVKKLLKE